MVENDVKKVFTDPMKPRVKALKEMMNSPGDAEKTSKFCLVCCGLARFFCQSS
jgi:hypothetical protein